MLEGNGIIVKSIDPQNKRKVLYHLTEKGIDLLPVILELKEWMKKYNAEVSECPTQPEYAGSSKEEIINEYREKLKKEHLVG